MKKPLVMKHVRKKWQSATDRETAKLIRKIQHAEDKELTGRRTRLAKGFSMALSSLTSEDIDALTPIIERIVGRAMLDKGRS